METGSLSAAARVLRITQPAASQQVKELERALATRLLQRGAGPVRPTAAGEAVLAQARRVQAAVDDLLAAAAAFQGGEVGRVRLGTGATACIHLLPPLLARMKQRMPGLEIIIATGNTSDMLARVLSGSLDLALVTLAGTAGPCAGGAAAAGRATGRLCPERDAAGRATRPAGDRSPRCR